MPNGGGDLQIPDPDNAGGGKSPRRSGWIEFVRARVDLGGRVARTAGVGAGRVLSLVGHRGSPMTAGRPEEGLA